MSNESISQWMDAASVRALAEGLMKPVVPAPEVTQDAIYGSGFVGFAEMAIEPLPALPSRFPEVRAESAPPPEMPAEIPKAPLPVVRPKLDLAAPFTIAEPAIGAIPAKVTPPETVQRPEPGLESIPELETGTQPIPQSGPGPQPVSVPPEVIVTSTKVDAAPVTEPIVRFKSPFKIATMPVQPSAPVVDSSAPTLRGQPLSRRIESFGRWLKSKVPAESYFVCDRNGEVVVDEVGSEKLVKVARTLAQASSGVGGQVGAADDPVSLHVKVGSDRVMEVIPRQSHFGPLILGIIVPRPLSREVVMEISKNLDQSLSES